MTTPPAPIRTDIVNDTPERDVHPDLHNDLAGAVNWLLENGGGGGGGGSSEVFNVKTYGALGDGVADDSAAFQATNDAAVAAGGGTMYIPAGIYSLRRTSTLSPPGDGVAWVLSSKVNVVGAGRGVTTLIVYPNNTSTIHPEWGATDITIRDLTCDLRPVVNGETDGVKLVNTQRVLVDNVEVIGGRIGIQVIKSLDVSVTNCLCRDQRRTVLSATSAGFSASDNPTHNGDKQVQWVNCISRNSDDYGWTINGASSGVIATGLSLVNCQVVQAGFAAPGVHTASTAGYAFNIRDAEVQLVNCTADTAYQYGFYLFGAAHQSQLSNCRATNTGVGGISGAGYYLQGVNDVSLVACRADASFGRGFMIETTNRAQLIGCRATGSTGGSGWGVDYNGCLDTVVLGMALNGNISPSQIRSGATFRDAYFGTNPVLKQTLAVAGSDPATTMALANSLRTALINLGLGA